MVTGHRTVRGEARYGYGVLSAVIAESTPATVGEWAAQLLEVVNQGLAFTSGGSIGRAFVTFALPVLDCLADQLMVDVRGVGFENTSPQSPLPVISHRAATQSLTLVTMYVTIARCVPNWDVDSPPNYSDLQAAAFIMNEDLWVTWNQLIAKIADGTLFAAPCMGVALAPPTPLEAQGGVGGWVFSLQAAISGFTPGA